MKTVPVPDYREIETVISLANITDQIATLLYASGMVHDNEDILKIEFEDFMPTGVCETIPIKIKIKKHQQVEVIQH